MTIEGFNRVGDRPLAHTVSRAVIYDANDNPIIAVVDLADGHTVFSTVLDPDFNQVLDKLGLNRSVVVKKVG